MSRMAGRAGVNRRTERERPGPGARAMSTELPRLFLARHGDTAWTVSRQHTGRTDLPLNERGEERARQISVGVLAFEHRCLKEPIIGLWNYVGQHRSEAKKLEEPAHQTSSANADLAHRDVT